MRLRVIHLTDRYGTEHVFWIFLLDDAELLPPGVVLELTDDSAVESRPV